MCFTRSSHEGARCHGRQTPHIEKHFTASETVRDIVIGMSDGLTVPFALAAGLSGAVDSTALLIHHRASSCYRGCKS